jgi:hypothetical protein
MFPGQYLEQGAVHMGMQMVCNEFDERIEIMNATFFESYDIDHKNFNWDKLKVNDGEKHAANAGKQISDHTKSKKVVEL